MSQKYKNQNMVKKNKKLVSIIVPAYKADKYLKQCLESLLNQTYPYIEIILVLEESDIPSKKIVNEYRDNDKLKIVEEKKNLGPAHTRNLAIKNSKGDYISFCDADDFFTDEKIEEQIRVIDNEFGLVYTDFSVVDENNRLIDKIKTPEWNFNKWIKSGYIAFSTVLVKKDFLEEVNFMDENLSSNEDFDLLIKLSKLTKFKRVPQFLAYRRIHNSNLSKNKETLLSRYYIYNKYGYRFIAIKSLIWGFVYSNIFYFLIKHESLYSVVKKLLKK